MAIVNPASFAQPGKVTASGVYPYAGLLPDPLPTSASWFPGHADPTGDYADSMAWPSRTDNQFPVMYEPPPFSLRRRGWSTSFPAVLYTGTPDITAYQDLNGSASLGYPFPACAQQLPLTQNWDGQYVPNDSLTNWIESNPVAATLIALAVMGVGVWFNGGAK